MHFYHLKAAENYKNAFKLIHATKIKCFNSCLYFYCIDQGVNPSAITANLSKVPPIIKKGQSHAELPEELQNKTEQMEGCKRAMLSGSHQPNTPHAF